MKYALIWGAGGALALHLGGAGALFWHGHGAERAGEPSQKALALVWQEETGKALMASQEETVVSPPAVVTKNLCAPKVLASKKTDNERPVLQKKSLPASFQVTENSPKGFEGAAPGGVQVCAAPDSTPIPVYAPAPAYPEDARRLKQEGTALVRLWITRVGSVARAQLVRGTNFEALDLAALSAVCAWRFKPTHTQSALVPVRFSLSRG